MRYPNTQRGIFLDRPNRFIAHVDVEGVVETVHVKNTGRCRELLVPGAAVYLEASANPQRKTAWDLIAVRKGDLLINMDAQAPNKVFAEWAMAGGFLAGVQSLSSEYRYGASRLDFALETPGGLHLVEVKGVTLEDGGVVYFPDAPTERGVKHLRELTRAKREGIDASAVFVVQMERAACFRPNDRTHAAFGEALREARDAGVGIVAVNCIVTPDTLSIKGRIPVVL